MLSRIILSSVLILFLAVCLFPLTVLPAVKEGLSDEELLEEIQRRALDYFLTERNDKTGLVHDRAHNFQRGAKASAASIAATGFALTAYPVGVEHNWIDVGTAREMTRQTLTFFLQQAESEHGFFYHFLDMSSGKRAGNSELSPIDTALFLAGALFAAEYYDDANLRELAQQIYERVDWNWMLHGGNSLAMAWSPEQGFSKWRWDHYNESMIMYLLAIGSPTHAIPASSWKDLYRPIGSYGGHRLIQMPPLFTHQYSHIWVDFRNKNDGFADYFKNSVEASLANRQFCIDESSKHQGYGPDSWGLTASDAQSGYKAFGAPPGWASHDGTLAPTGCGSSIVFTPKESMACLRHFYENYGDKIWGMYGFSDAFNVDRDWYDQEVIGIDQGALMLMIENYRSGFVWDVMSRNEAIKRAMEAVGFKEGSLDLPWPDPPQVHIPYVLGGIEVDGYLKDWDKRGMITLDLSNRESGGFNNDKDLKADMAFAWNENALYFYAKITDESVIARKSGRNIWMDDLLELHIDPAGDGYRWESYKDFQLGFSPREGSNEVEAWSWFQGGDDPQVTGGVKAKGYVYGGGYIIEGSIPWRYLNFQPEGGKTLHISPAVHDIDADRTSGKIHWFFRSEDGLGRFELGRLVLDPKQIVKSEKAQTVKA